MNRSARQMGLACGLVAATLGFFYLAAAGAPLTFLAIQAAALAIGLVSLPILGILSRNSPPRGPSLVLLLLGAALLLTALSGVSASGATRWVRLGSITLQPSLILLPAMLVLYARRPGLAGTVGIVLAALALALQPDRAMAGVLATSLLLLAFWRREALVIGAALSGVAALAVAFAQPDSLPAVPFVDNVLYSAFEVHPLAGIAVLAGSAIMLLPALGAGEPRERLVFGAVWLAIVAAAALGNYPTPLVGYGGSAILGYWLSVALLPGRSRLGSVEHSSSAPLQDGSRHDPFLRAAA